MTSSNIEFVLSGGATNTNPNQSLGGPPSSRPLIGVLNNLFDDVVLSDAQRGKIDHRCFYIFNDDSRNTWDEVKLWIVSSPSCCTVELGFSFIDEIQQIRFNGATSGSITFGFGDGLFVLVWTNDSNQVAASIQSGLRRIPGLSDVSCVATSDSIYTVTFSGADGGRAQPLITILDNRLNSGATCSVQRIIQGLPVNADTVKIAVSTASPYGIAFGPATEDAPIVIGRLEAGDGIPIWVRRTIPVNSTSVTDATFQLRLSGNIVPPPEEIVSTYASVMQGTVLLNGTNAPQVNRSQDMTGTIEVNGQIA